MKILCTGDVHIGRRSSRLPPAFDSRSHSSAEAWSRTVDAALGQEVDVVAISGDLIDEANRFFEAFGPVERGISRLRAAGIEVVMVAGNHDHEVLPRIAAGLPQQGVHLLGRGGTWSRVTIERRGERLHLDGWSFPRQQFPSSPLAIYSPELDRTPVLALLHADLDVPMSPYAPISRSELRGFPDTFFLLGHVHAPRFFDDDGAGRAMYPGSPQALDPMEPGVHGAHLLEIGAGVLQRVMIPLSTVRYDVVPLDLTGVDRVEEVEARIAGAVRDAVDEMSAIQPHLQHLRCRVRLTGVTSTHRHLDEELRARARDLEVDTGRASASIDQLLVDTLPVRNLETLSGMPGAPGVLARLLRSLDEGSLDEGQSQLLRDAVRASREVRSASPYIEVAETELDASIEDAAIRGELRSAAGRLLDELLAQREEPL